MKGRSKQTKVILVNYMQSWGSHFKTVHSILPLIGDKII